MWISILIILLIFIALVGWLLIYSGNACEYDDKDKDCDYEECWHCRHCSRIWGVCRLTNAHVRKGQKCNVDEELAKQESFKKK